MSTAPLEITVSRHFLAWLHEAHVSLAFTTYQTNRLFLLGLKPDGRLSAFERHFERPMGLHATPARLYMSTRWQLWKLDDALPAGVTHNGYDRLYVPRRAYTTGELDVHDVAVDGAGRIVFVNTLYGCVATVSEHYSFRPLWRPPFLSALVPEDRCHLNGLAMADGHPAYATAVSRSDVVTGWRERREAGGCVIDVEDNEIVLDSLSMPHSPRVYHDRLWVLNSGTGELGYVDRGRGCFEPLVFCPGYLRGLVFHADYAVVGLSKPRRERTFSGLALDERLKQKDSEARCGLWVIDLKRARVAHWMELEGVVLELYDVGVLVGVRRPMALGFKNNEIQRLITIETTPQPIFEPLGVPDPASSASHAGSVAADGSASSAAPAPRPAARAAAGPASDAARAAYRRANQLVKEGHLAAAIPHYEEALRHDPGLVNALVNLGTVQHRLGHAQAALECYRRAVATDARSVRARANLATVLEACGALRVAAEHYRAALGVEPGNADLLNGLGLALYESGQLAEARGVFTRAIEALELHRRAAALDPGFFEAHENIGKMLEEQGQVPEARAAYRRALSIRDEPVLALHQALLCPPVFPNTEELDAYRARAAAVIDVFTGRELRLPPGHVQSSRAEPPFEWIYHGRDNLALKRQYAHLFDGAFAGAPLERRPGAAGPWRIGFVVTPGHEGVFVRCMSGIITRLDPRRFQTTVICARPGAAVLRAAIRRPEVRFLYFPLRFDHAVTEIRAAALDLLYFWEVGTDSTNYFLPFQRLAPVQVTGWGWPDTSGAPALDAHPTSAALAPAGAEQFFSETLVRLPHLPPYFFFPPIPARSPAAGKPAGGRGRAHLSLRAKPA